MYECTFPAENLLPCVSSQVRTGAEKCLVSIIRCSGPAPLHKILRDMKPAQLKALKPLCDKAEKAALSDGGAAPAAAAAADDHIAAAPSAKVAPSAAPTTKKITAKEPVARVAAAAAEPAAAPAMAADDEEPLKVSSRHHAAHTCSIMDQSGRSSSMPCDGEPLQRCMQHQCV